MIISQAKLVFGLIGVILFFNSCARNKPPEGNVKSSNGNQTANSAEQFVPKDDVEELGKIIKLPLMPEEATFSEIALNNTDSEPRTPAENDRKIVVVLKYSAENANRIAAAAEKHKPLTPSDVEAESWFPPELVAQSQISGDEVLKGVAYAADDFFQPPFNNGKLIRVNNSDYFVLELLTY